MATDKYIFEQPSSDAGFVGKNQIQPVINASTPVIPSVNAGFNKVSEARDSAVVINTAKDSLANVGTTSSAAAEKALLGGFNDTNLTIAPPKGVTKVAAKAATKSADTSKQQVVGKQGDVSVNIAEVAIAAKLDSNDVLSIYTYLCGPGNINLLAAWIYLLYNANGAVGMTVSADQNTNKKDQPITIGGNMLMYMWTRGNAVIKNKFHRGVMKAFKKTPAYKTKFFEDVGDIGVTLVSNSERVSHTPVYGPAKHTPSLLEKALNKIHPKFTEELEKYCNVLKGKLYVALPGNILGSIQSLVNYISGVVTAFAQMIGEVYQGCLKAIKDFVALIDGIMQPIMLWLLTLLDSIIPLDIICLILDILSLFVGDLTMYTNLFTQSLKISDVLSTFNINAGPLGDFLSNPISTLKSFLPENIQNILDLANTSGSDPMGYLGQVLNNYGYGYMLNYLKGDIMGGVLNQFGSKAPILYPISGIMKKYGFNGKINFSDPTKPVPDVVLPPALVAMRAGFKRTFDAMGNSLDKARGDIADSIFEVTGVDPSAKSNDLGISRTRY